uniref:Zinc metalloproteinase n=1 Tax=Rhabditophanes sp. KR3021 TaxID=114890 RepID=A0AC35U6C5_9BILA
MQFLILLLCLLAIFVPLKATTKEDIFNATRSTLTTEQKIQFDKNSKKLEMIRAIQRKIFEEQQTGKSAEMASIAGAAEINIKKDPMLNPHMFQGDMFLTDTQMDKVISDIQNELDNKAKASSISNRSKRSIDAVMSFKWKFPIRYYLGPTLSVSDKNVIEASLTELKASTCVKFSKQLSPIVGFPGLNIKKAEGCWSYVGQIFSNQPQDVSIGEGCQHIGIIQHELSHALGLEHEQSRPDRDNYLFIYPANIISGLEDQFVKASASSVKDYGILFDFGSAMLYPKTAFSKNGQNTVVPKIAVYYEAVGQHSRLSFSDYKMINLHYCSTACILKIKCLNGGFQNPNKCTQCICPNGFAGVFCSEIKKTGAICGNIELKATAYAQVLTRYGAVNCYFRITTDTNYKIKIIVKSVDVSVADPCVVGRGLEVKFRSDMTYSGAVFCGKNNTARTITSARNLAMIHYPGLASSHSFILTYQRIV